MLAFIDESYQTLAPTDVWTALAAVCIPREKMREVAKDLFRLKKRFWGVARPDEIELKGAKLLNPRAIQLPKNRDLAQQLTSLCRLHEIVPFAVAQKSAEGLELSRLRDAGDLPDLHKGIVRRVREFIRDKAPERKALLFFDERDRETNRRISRAFRGFLFRSREGQQMEEIVEVPFFYDSEITPAGQIADVVAYVMCSRYAGRRTDPYLEGVFAELRRLTHNASGTHEDGKVWRMWGLSALGVREEQDTGT